MLKELENWFDNKEKQFLKKGMNTGQIRKIENSDRNESGMEITISTDSMSGRIFLKSSGAVESEITDVVENKTLSYEYQEIGDQFLPEELFEDFIALMDLEDEGCSSCQSCCKKQNTCGSET